MKKRMYCSFLMTQRTEEFFFPLSGELNKGEAESIILVTKEKVGLNALPESTRQFHP